MKILAAVLCGLVCASTGLAQTTSPPFLLRDINWGSGDSSMAHPFATHEALYFRATTAGTGAELWRTDGTGTGTTLVRDIVQGSGSSNATPIGSLGAQLYFAGTNNSLWISNGSSAGTKILLGRRGSNGLNWTGKFWISANGGSKGDGIFSFLSDKETLVHLTQSSNLPTDLAAVGGYLYWAQFGTGSGIELFRSQGTASSLKKFELEPGARSSFPRVVGQVGNTAILIARTSTRGAELWKADATGVALLKDVNPGTGHGVSASPAPVTMGGHVYFVGDDGASGLELWKTNGTANGTVLVKDIVAGSGSGAPEEMIVAGDRVFFTATTPATGRELWCSDGTANGTILVGEVIAGAADSNPRELTRLGGALYFSADGRAGIPADRELYTVLCNGGGPRRVADMRLGIGSADPRSLAAFRGKLIFSADAANSIGREVYAYDGTLPTPNPIVVRVSIKRIIDRNGNYGVWSNKRIDDMMREVNAVYMRHAGVRFQYTVTNLLDPGVPNSWAEFRTTSKRAMEAAAEAEPCKYAWRTDAINIYLAQKIPDAGGVCSFPACPNDRNDIVFIQPAILNDALGLAHEIGHYLNLRHTHANHESGGCSGCPGGPTHGDCVGDTRDDSKPNTTETNWIQKHNTRLVNIAKAKGYSPEEHENLRYNVMSYHAPITHENAVFTCGQVHRMTLALRGPRRNVVVGNAVPRLIGVTPATGTYPSIQTVRVSGTGLPASGASLRIGGQTATASGSATSLSARFTNPVAPGRHCVSLMQNGQPISTFDPLAVRPHLTWQVGGGNLSLLVQSAAPNAGVIVAAGPPASATVLPGALYVLLVNPLATFGVTTDASGRRQINQSLATVPQLVDITVQALERGTPSHRLSNALRLVLVR